MPQFHQTNYYKPDSDFFTRQDYDAYLLVQPKIDALESNRLLEQQMMEQNIANILAAIVKYRADIKQEQNKSDNSEFRSYGFFLNVIDNIVNSIKQAQELPSPEERGSKIIQVIINGFTARNFNELMKKENERWGSVYAVKGIIEITDAHMAYVMKILQPFIDPLETAVVRYGADIAPFQQLQPNMKARHLLKEALVNAIEEIKKVSQRPVSSVCEELLGALGRGNTPNLEATVKSYSTLSAADGQIAELRSLFKAHQDNELLVAGGTFNADVIQELVSKKALHAMEENAKATVPSTELQEDKKRDDELDVLRSREDEHVAVPEEARKALEAQQKAEAKRQQEAQAEAKRQQEAQAEAKRQQEAQAEAKRQQEAQAEAKRQQEAQAEAKRQQEAQAQQVNQILTGINTSLLQLEQRINSEKAHHPNEEAFTTSKALVQNLKTAFETLKMQIKESKTPKIHIDEFKNIVEQEISTARPILAKEIGLWNAFKDFLKSVSNFFAPIHRQGFFAPNDFNSAKRVNAINSVEDTKKEIDATINPKM